MSRQFEAPPEIQSHLLCPAIRRVVVTALALIAAAFTLTACNERDTSIQAIFAPGCIAFEGDRVEFDGERFIWDRFTDQIMIGPDGEPVDPFPAFPKTGAYRLQGDRVEFAPDDGSRIDNRYLDLSGEMPRLLTAGEFAALEAGESLPACVLTEVDASN